MNKKLIVLSSTFPNDLDETFLIQELKYLKSAFEDVTLFPIDITYGASTYDGTRVLRISNKKTSWFYIFLSFFQLEFLKEFFRIITSKKSNKFLMIKTALKSWIESKKIAEVLKEEQNLETTVFYSYWGVNGAIALAIISSENPTLKTISRFHGWDVFEDANALNYLPFRKYIASNVKNLVPISEAGRKAILNWGCKVEPETAYLGSENYTSLNQKEGTGIVMLSISNFNSVKRIPLFFEAMQHVKSKVCWIHIGDGPNATSIIKRGVALLPNNIQFIHKGQLGHQEVLDFIDSEPISFLVNLSKSEGIPVSMMEVMSFGIPVFATNVGGVSEIVDNNCGKLISVQMTDYEIANELELFINENLKEKGKMARKVWEEKFNSSVNYKKFAEKLCSLK